MDDDRILEISTALDVARHVQEIYGDDLTSTGVLHVTAVWNGGRGAYVTLDITPDTPKSQHDLFALGLARARADAIVTTGRILRREPDLSHRLPGSSTFSRALAEWRQGVLGKTTPPITLILTSGRDLDFEHPIFRGPTRPVIFTHPEGHWQLESRAADHGVEVVGVPSPSIQGAVEFLRREFGAATLSIEAGPSTSRQLYEPDLLVDELLLSVFEAPRIPGSVEGGFFLPRPDLFRLFSHVSDPFGVVTADGSWNLQRFLR